MPDATLAASYQAYNDANRRSDKAFTPHPTCFPSNQNNSASPPTITPDTATIAGLVTEREAKAAADIASRVSGVKRVTTAFTFIK